MSLPEIPLHDYRDGSLLGFALDHAAQADALMALVLTGAGLAPGMVAPALRLADQIATRRLWAMRDPFQDEILAVARQIKRPGPVFFNLSYEFGCTARVFETGGPPRLFRTLDWPFQGLGAEIRVIRLRAPAGEWALASWPGIMGCLQGVAPGRFTIALNQAPALQSGLGRGIDWLIQKQHFFRAEGIPPAHLLRQVFESAPDYATAARMLAETPVAAPVIFTLAGMAPGEACVIERRETSHAARPDPIAANHFETGLRREATWRARGIQSHARQRQAAGLAKMPCLTDLPEPVLNAQTRLAFAADAGGFLVLAGYEGPAQVTELAEFDLG
ncbi:MAG: hypothetical protein AAGI70_08965 [Pseudomonadota bacterium]